MKLLIADIEESIEKGYYSTQNIAVVEILLSSINDWPNSIVSLDDFEIEVRDFILAEPVKANIENRLKNIDFNKYAWEAESLSQLLEVYNYFNDNISLQEIINELKQQSPI
jgi:predicted Zn-dependent peptidase